MAGSKKDTHFDAAERRELQAFMRTSNDVPLDAYGRAAPAGAYEVNLADSPVFHFGTLNKAATTVAAPNPLAQGVTHAAVPLRESVSSASELPLSSAVAQTGPTDSEFWYKFHLETNKLHNQERKLWEVEREQLIAEKQALVEENKALIEQLAGLWASSSRQESLAGSGGNSQHTGSRNDSGVAGFANKENVRPIFGNGAAIVHNANEKLRQISVVSPGGFGYSGNHSPVHHDGSTVASMLTGPAVAGGAGPDLVNRLEKVAAAGVSLPSILEDGEHPKPSKRPRVSFSTDERNLDGAILDSQTNTPTTTPGYSRLLSAPYPAVSPPPASYTLHAGHTPIASGSKTPAVRDRHNSLELARQWMESGSLASKSRRMLPTHPSLSDESVDAFHQQLKEIANNPDHYPPEALRRSPPQSPESGSESGDADAAAPSAVAAAPSAVAGVSSAVAGASSAVAGQEERAEDEGVEDDGIKDDGTEDDEDEDIPLKFKTSPTLNFGAKLGKLT